MPGVRGLFDGISGTWMRQMSYSLCRFWAYDESKKLLGAGASSMRLSVRACEDVSLTIASWVFVFWVMGDLSGGRAACCVLCGQDPARLRGSSRPRGVWVGLVFLASFLPSLPRFAIAHLAPARLVSHFRLSSLTFASPRLPTHPAPRPADPNTIERARTPRSNATTD